jgi:stage III sporulation protein AF
VFHVFPGNYIDDRCRKSDFDDEVIEVMNYIYEWVTNIILIILLATILELLLPSSAFQKYVKVVIGLLLIISILNPLIKLFSVDLNARMASLQLEGGVMETENMKNLIENKKSEIQASQDAYILEQMAVQLRQQVDGKLKEQFQKRLKDVVVQEKSQIGSKEGQWVVHVTVESFEGNDSVEVVKDVSIDTASLSEKDQTETDNLTELEQFLSKEWEIPTDQIVLTEEGGS